VPRRNRPTPNAEPCRRSKHTQHDTETEQEEKSAESNFLFSALTQKSKSCRPRPTEATPQQTSEGQRTLDQYPQRTAGALRAKASADDNGTKMLEKGNDRISFCGNN
jgi:hypothetical protein